MLGSFCLFFYYAKRNSAAVAAGAQLQLFAGQGRWDTNEECNM